MPRYTTHVANAYHEDIWVMVATDIAYVKISDFSASVSAHIKGVELKSSLGMKTEYDWKFAKKNGYTRIAPREVTGFNPDVSSKSTVYITVVTASGIVVCECFPREYDYSVIVDKEAYIRCTQYGKLWVDEQGEGH